MTIIHSATHNRFHQLAVAAIAVGLASLGFASGAEARASHRVRGTVVHRNQQAGSFVVAHSAGRLFAIHARTSPPLRRQVTVSVRRLSNGTLAARKLRANGSSARVHARGVVSHVNGAADTFVLSAEGVSMLVKGSPGSRLPPVGKVVAVTGSVSEEDEGEIEEEGMQDEGQQSAFDIEGSILEVNASAHTLLISADDDQASGEAVTVLVPASLEISKFSVGQEVDLKVAPLPGGGFEVLASASDQGEEAAEDNEDDQGESGDSEGGDSLL